MRNDPPRPTPDPKKIIGKTSKHAHEATELDLWDLDSEGSDFVQPPAPSSEPAGLPARRQTGSSTLQSRKPTERPINVPEVEVIKPTENPSAEPPADPAAPGDDALPQPVADGDKALSGNEEPETPPPSPLSAIASLTKIEKIAISCLFAVLALGATLSIIHFSNRVPTRPLIAEKIDYPVQGESIVIEEAVTYWRAPVTTGENPDIVRRGTRLLPVLKLSLSAKAGAIRVFFRNDEGVVVGDGITRSVKGEMELIIAATAGFEDVGMHTAYRTGGSEPWVVQVFEGPDADAPREKFRMVLETEISSHVR